MLYEASTFFLFPTLSFSQTIVLSDDILINTYVSPENERMYLFYPDKLVLSKDIIPLLKTPHIDYDHSTRIMRDTLFQINFKLKGLVKSETDVIVIKKSDYDKRIKQYSINQKLFNKS